MQFDWLKRREFIFLAGGAAASWPLAARAQRPGKLPTIGYLGPHTRSPDSPRLEAFVQRLRELGWIEGRTIAFEYRWAEGRNEHLAEIMAEFVKRRVDVISYVGDSAYGCGEAGDVGHPDRIRSSRRPGRCWRGGILGTTGW
jgi:putative ABC transport system substrate-binding protein